MRQLTAELRLECVKKIDSVFSKYCSGKKTMYSMLLNMFSVPFGYWFAAIALLFFVSRFCGYNPLFPPAPHFWYPNEPTMYGPIGFRSPIYRRRRRRRAYYDPWGGW